MILKQKLKFGLLLAWVALLFVACEYDEKTMDYHTQDHAEKHLKVSKVNFNQLQNNKKLMDRLGKLKNTTQQTAARIIQSNDNSFYIDTDFAYLIESENGKHSYTFQIIRQNPQYRLENLILKKNNTDGYNLFIAQYDITESEYEQLQNGENPSLINKLNIVPVANNTIDANLVFNRTTGMCLTVTTILGNTCPGPGHHTLEDVLGGEFCPYFSDGDFTLYAEQTIYSWEPCDQQNTGGGGGIIDDGNPDNSGGFPTGPANENPIGGNSGTTDPVNTPPNDNDTDPDNSFDDTPDPVHTTPNTGESNRNNPCVKIKNLTSSSNFKTKFKALNTPSKFNSSQESGFGLVGNDYVDGTPNNHNMIDYPAQSKSAVHVHNNKPQTTSNGINYDGAIKILSPADLMLLLRDFQIRSNPNPENAYHIMISNEGIYAITILEPIPFNPELVEKFNKFKMEYLIRAQEIIDGLYSTSVRKKALQKMFLKGLKEMGLEDKIGFFEASLENENTSDINNYNINWTRKKLNNNLNGGIEDTPCN